MAAEKKIFPLQGKVQHYDWGGYDFIPSLLHIENSNHQPFAEYWLGAHNAAPAIVKINNEDKPLNDFINADAEKLLGKKVNSQFKRLPYLLKILDVKKMLSIQVHPLKADAEKEFARENEENIPLNSSNRNYKDDNHKPELMVALSEFWLLHGFKAEKELIYTLLNVAELRELLPVFNQAGYAGLYKHVMEMQQEEVNRILRPLINNVVKMYHANEADKDDEDFWAARAALTFNERNNIDRGIFSVYLFNLVKLNKREAIFQDAGVPHAYLEGQNIEIMANSDNVLRGGLTTKHIDVPELLKHVKFQAVEPDILKPVSSGGIKIFKTPAADFELSMSDMGTGDVISFLSKTASIIFILKGSIQINDKDEELILQQGQSAVLFAGVQVQLTALKDAEWYMASVP